MRIAIGFIAGVTFGTYVTYLSEHYDDTVSLSTKGKIAYHLRFLFSGPVRTGLKLWHKAF